MRQEHDHEGDEEAVQFRMNPEEEVSPDEAETVEPPVADLIIPTTPEFDQDVTAELMKTGEYRRLLSQKRFYEAQTARLGKTTFIGPDDAHFIEDPNRAERDLDAQIEKMRQEMRIQIVTDRAKKAAEREATKHISSAALSPAEKRDEEPGDDALSQTFK